LSPHEAQRVLTEGNMRKEIVESPKNRAHVLNAGVLVCVLLAFVAELGVWQSAWIQPLLGADEGRTVFGLRIGADVLTLAACGLACFVLSRVAWWMRRQSPLVMAACGLALVLGLSGLKRLVDLVHVVTGSLSPAADPFAAFGSLLLAAGVLLMLPLLRKVSSFGSAAELAQERFHSAAETGRQAFFILECEYGKLRRILDFRFSFVNSNAEKLLLTRRGELVGMPLSRALPTAGESGLFDKLRQVARTGLPYGGEVRYISEEGAELWFDLRAVRTKGGVAVTLHDLSGERNKQKQVDELHRFSQSLIQDAPFAILATDTRGMITAVNPAAERLTQFRKEEMIGQLSMIDLHDPEELKERLVEQLGLDADDVPDFRALLSSLGQRSSAEADWHYLCRDRTRVPVHVSLTTLRGEDSAITGYLATAYDISERKKLVDSITFLAQHDGLTGLPNRVRLRERLEQALEKARRLGQPLSVLSIGLDNFKRVNDSLGHTAGDELLVLMAERLRGSTRCNDTVARIGGDTFVVVMPNCGTNEDMQRAAARLTGKIQLPAVIGGRELIVNASIGICRFPDWGEDTATLLRRADAAMYAAKRAGRNCVQAFSSALAESGADELEMEACLRHSLANDEMLLYYQPLVNCRSGELQGVEALLRWRHPQRGLLAPSEFINTAEDSGFILPLGQWVVERACLEGRRLQERLGRRITIAVNLSPRQFLQPGMAEMVEQSLRNSGLAPADLELEITEYTLMISSAETVAALNRLRTLGVRIALDDFGTGFSSFKYLLEHKVDRLKIDRSFVAKCPGDQNAAAIVRAVIAMAHGLGLEVVAEGVETEEQREFLARRRCDRAQGFYFGRPMSEEALIAGLQALPRATMSSKGARVTEIRPRELAS
jgi:diguanylate cyclase (GGDEF)-like protein/PAS domain S-box-containing protein